MVDVVLTHSIAALREYDRLAAEWVRRADAHDFDERDETGANTFETLTHEAEAARKACGRALFEDTRDRNCLENCMMTLPEPLWLWKHRGDPDRRSTFRRWVEDGTLWREVT